MNTSSLTPIWSPEDFAALAAEADQHRSEAVDLRVELDWTIGVQR